MKFEKFNILKLNNGKKVVILEKIVYNNVTYLYVDDVNDDETDTLDNYYIIRVNPNNTLSLETNKDTLENIIPIFNRTVKDNFN